MSCRQRDLARRAPGGALDETSARSTRSSASHGWRCVSKEEIMPRQLTVQEREAFLADRHIAVLSVASDSARPPLTVPVWYSYTPGGNLTFFTGTGGRKARKTRLIQQAGVVRMSVQREAFPYRY